MREPRAVSAAMEPVEAEYRALADHCIGCRTCRRATAIACPEASRLRRAWAAAFRAARGGGR